MKIIVAATIIIIIIIIITIIITIIIIVVGGPPFSMKSIVVLSLMSPGVAYEPNPGGADSGTMGTLKRYCC